MKWINLELAKSRGLASYDVGLLLGIEEGMVDDIREYILGVPEVYLFYQSLGIVEEIKGTKKQPQEEKIRLSKKGKAWLREFFTKEIEITDVARRVHQFLVDKYKESGMDKRIANEVKVLKYIQEFMNMTDYNERVMCFVIEEYVKSVDNPEYLLATDNLFFKFPNPYSKKLSLENSELYGFILRKKEENKKK